MERPALLRTGFTLLLALSLGLQPALHREAPGPFAGDGVVLSAWEVEAGDGIAQPRGYLFDGVRERHAAATLVVFAAAPAAPHSHAPASARSIRSRTVATTSHLALLTNVLLLDGG